MLNLSQIQKNLESILSDWRTLTDDQKRLKINIILPFVQVLSFVNGLQKLELIPTNESLLEHQESFREDYERLFGQDLLKMKSSDFSPEAFDIISKVQSGESLYKDDREELLRYDKKYIHAHSRIMFNYGNFLQQIFHNLDTDRQTNIRTKAAELYDDNNNTVETLFDLNDLFELERNSGHLQKDDVENHALLAQISNYLQNLSLVELLLDDQSTEEIKTFILSQDHPLKLSIKRVKQDNQQISKDFDEGLEKVGLAIQVGLETEFSLLSLASKSEVQTPIQKNVALKKLLSDSNSRRYMEIRFGSLPTIPEISNLTEFYEDAEINSLGGEGMVIARKDFLAIITDLKYFLGVTQSESVIEKHVANFTEAEAFFYNLLFLSEDFAANNKIEINGLYDPNKTRKENLARVWELIKVGRLHEHLLDMIQAYEISFGPHEFFKIIDVKNQVLEKMRFLANYSELSLDDPNVQINLSLWVRDADGRSRNALLPEFKDEGGQVKIYFNQLGLEFLQIIEQVVAEAETEVGGILRNQKEIESAFDRRKHVLERLRGTPYLEVDSGPSYLIHRIGGAKNVVIRVSMINDEVAVSEIRLIGNNPHFAKFEEGEDVYKSGLEFIPEALIPRIAKKMQEFIIGKSKEQLLEMYQQKVSIKTDGRFDGLESVMVREKRPDKIFNPCETERYNPTLPKNSVSIVSCKMVEDSAHIVR